MVDSGLSLLTGTSSNISSHKQQLEEVDTITNNQVDAAAVTDAIKKQIEYYFSKENLNSDKFLMSQMDTQMSVALSVIMKVSYFVISGKLETSHISKTISTTTFSNDSQIVPESDFPLSRRKLYTGSAKRFHSGNFRR